MQALKITHQLVIVSPPESNEELASIVGEMSTMANVEIDSVSFSPMFEEEGPISINLNFLTEEARDTFREHKEARKHFARTMLSKCDCENCKEQLKNLDATFERIEREEQGAQVPTEDKIIMGAPSTLQ